MPKRPCALALTPDNRTVLSADKFGDVYALPLLPSTTTTATSLPSTPNPAAGPAATTASTPPSGSATPSTPGVASTFKPQANELTVHTKRNLRALENQKLSLGLKAARQQDSQDQQQQPSFEHTLLLGHVSMLTAICVGTATVDATTTLSGGSGNDGDEAQQAQGRRRREYIITADRDEHIRVSRGMPQAHVIEGFCLGHEDFVSRLCMAPGGREGILISGGGDDDLFVWDWVAGKLLGRASVLEHVKGVVGEDANKVAVTRVFSCQWEGATAVFVVAERYVYSFVPLYFDPG
jgi:tRNA (guanine-N(7)-)-methyltransferase subunit TRM82